MIALDTNVVVRFLVNDDAIQARRARTLIDDHNVFIAPTVLLEAEWVLRSAYGFSQREILKFFRALLGLPGITVGEPSRIDSALNRYREGLDFADALHLAFSTDAEAFATFDTKLRRRALRSDIPPEVIAA